MHVDRSHRGDLVVYDSEAYVALADRCVSEISKVEDVVSIVLCGSLAKGNLVPGWSDIDIIVFVASHASGLAVLGQVKSALKIARSDMAVGIGLDIVYEDQFLESHKLCGRPYMMTYEVAGYGQLCYGKDLFAGIVYDENARTRVASERYQLIASEVHSWRRAYINQGQSFRDDANWLFTCAKALLRILQCETGPNLVAPIGSAGSLERFMRDRQGHPAVPAFVAAIDIRQRWPEFLAEGSDVGGLSVILAQAINSYPLNLPKVP